MRSRYREQQIRQRIRFPELDLLRFLAACAVLLFHFAFFGPQQHLWPAAFPILGGIFRYGYLGVDLFFILSGFVILLTAYDKDAIGFAIARMVRLYPAYWICVTTTTVAIVLVGSSLRSVSLDQYLANLTMAHGYIGIKDVSGVYWTLAVELKFYFLIFVVLALRQIRRLSPVLGIWLVASILLSLRAPGGIGWFFLFPEWSSYFIAGAMFFLIHREGPSPYKLSVIAACCLLSIGYATKSVPAAAGPQDDGVNTIVLTVTIATFYIVFLAIALRGQRFETPRKIAAGTGRASGASKLIPILGLITYPLYLIHQDIGFIMLRAAAGLLNQYLVLFLVMGSMIALAWLIYAGPEKWLAARLKKALLSLRKSVSPSDAAKAAPQTEQIHLRLAATEALLRRTSDRGVEQPGSSSGS